MEQYELNKDELILRVKKAPVLIRGALYFFAFFSFLAPIAGFVFNIASGEGLKFGNIILIALFGIIGFFFFTKCIMEYVWGRTNKFQPQGNKLCG